MENNQDKLVLDEEHWQQCSERWNKKAESLFGDKTAKARKVLDKAFRGFIVEFATQINCPRSLDGRPGAEWEAGKRALTFHCIATLNQLTQAGLSREDAYQKLKKTIQYAVRFFDEVVNVDSNYDAPFVPRHADASGDRDKQSLEKLFEMLENIKTSWGMSR